MKKTFCIFLSLLLLILSFSLIACGCEHENLTLIEDTATCENDGVKKYRCDNCNKIIENFSNKTGHDYSILVSDTATCTTSGYKTYKCSKCDETKAEESSELGHNFSGCMCSRCNSIHPDYKEVKINYTSKSFKYTEQFSSLSGNYALLSVTFSNENTVLDIWASGQIYYYGSLRFVDFYIYVYDSNNIKIASVSFGYIPRSGELFSTTKTTNLIHPINEGDICYIKLNATINN